ncbi:four-helix bundle copper-binding protein [Geomonas sp. RF6]|uniref:four-helix bundle copper-binding protein n=1 Tax=Geomonas sp. RF6 TaxID=2897342 RepID=UPI001E4D5E6C|nr:four-helix bundle copper-binding protein [Geomonas sp. RF6]UFS70588.1 four-helix bundle copper-binding protein [Geomonas sp. RF6]
MNQEMLRTHPRKPFFDLDQLTACLAACTECADTCTICADACLSEEKVQMLTKCIRFDLDCADICSTTARVLSRQTEPNAQLMLMQLESCATACRLCADECQSHAEMHRHCRVCAESCRNCEQRCRDLISSMPGITGRK